MASSPRSTVREPAARSMSSRTLAVTGAVLLLGGFVVYKGISKPNALASTGTGTPSVTTAPKGSVTATATGSSTTAAAIIAPTTVPVNAKVDVYVANGAEIAGIAGRVTAALQKKGYQLRLPPTNATPGEASTVFYNPGNERLAALVAKDLNIATVTAMATPSPVKDLGTAQVLVVLGRTFKETDIPATSSLQAAGGAAPVITAATTVTTAKPASAVTTPAVVTTKKP